MLTSNNLGCMCTTCSPFVVEIVAVPAIFSVLLQTSLTSPESPSSLAASDHPPSVCKSDQSVPHSIPNYMHTSYVQTAICCLLLMLWDYIRDLDYYYTGCVVVTWADCSLLLIVTFAVSSSNGRLPTSSQHCFNEKWLSKLDIAIPDAPCSNPLVDILHLHDHDLEWTVNYVYQFSIRNRSDYNAGVEYWLQISSEKVITSIYDRINAMHVQYCIITYRKTGDGLNKIADLHGDIPTHSI